jgi:hypothetical protein
VDDGAEVPQHRRLVRELGGRDLALLERGVEVELVDEARPALQVETHPERAPVQEDRRHEQARDRQQDQREGQGELA